jgi:hypothetical protein
MNGADILILIFGMVFIALIAYTLGYYRGKEG